MKLVIGIVRPEQANDVLEALYRAEVRGLSISRVQGHGGELDRVETYRGTTREDGALPRRSASRSRSPTSSSSRRSRRSARERGPVEVGDGKIFVVPLERAVRIRTGETDHGAVTPVDARDARPQVNAGDTAWMLVATALVLMMTPALGLFYAASCARRTR